MPTFTCRKWWYHEVFLTACDTSVYHKCSESVKIKFTIGQRENVTKCSIIYEGTINISFTAGVTLLFFLDILYSWKLIWYIEIFFYLKNKTGSILQLKGLHRDTLLNWNTLSNKTLNKADTHLYKLYPFIIRKTQLKNVFTRFYIKP